MAEQRLPPTSPTTGANDASTSGSPSAHPPGIFYEPSHRINDGSRGSQPSPHPQLPPQQYWPAPSQHGHPPHSPNLFHGPPQPMSPPAYGVTQEPPPWSPAHTLHHEYFDLGYQPQPPNALPYDIHMHQDVGLPPQGLVPPPLTPYASPTLFYSLPQGYTTPHVGPTPSWHVHNVPTPPLPNPQACPGYSRGEALALHYALLRQDPSGPLHELPHYRPPQALVPVETRQKGKRKTPDSKDIQRAPKKLRRKQIPQLFPKRAKPGRPPKEVSAARRRLEQEWIAANAQLEASSSTAHVPLISPQPEASEILSIPFQIEMEPEPSTPARQQTGNLLTSTTSPRPDPSAEALAANARAYEGVCHTWFMFPSLSGVASLSSGYYDFINKYPPLYPHNNDPTFSLIPPEWSDLRNYPPLEDPSWPSINSLTRRNVYIFNVEDLSSDSRSVQRSIERAW